MSGTPISQADPAATNYQFASKGFIDAMATVERVVSILGLRAGGDAADDGASVKVRLSRLSPAYRDALQGELRLLRAQLYSTGLFDTILNVDLGEGDQ